MLILSPFSLQETIKKKKNITPYGKILICYRDKI